MIVRKNAILIFKKRNKEEVLNGMKITLDKQMIENLKVTPEENLVILSYKEKKLKITKGTVEREESFKNIDGTIEFIKNSQVNWEKNSNYLTPKLNIPLGIGNEWKLSKEDKKIEVELQNNALIIRRKENMVDYVKDKEGKEISTILLESKNIEGRNFFIKRNGKVFTIKVGKGGIGKSFITTQLATGLAEIAKINDKDIKILVITSDPQNDIMGMCFKDGEIPPYKGGLKAWVSKGNGDIVKLRENVDFIPLEEATFSTTFIKKLPEFFYKMRMKYDYILIDSMPMMAIDKHFHHNSDKVILPINGDKFTVNGAIKVIQEIGIDKVFAVVFNKFENTTGQKNYYEQMKKNIDGTNVLLPKPIKNLVHIYKLNESGKTIWDSKKKTDEGFEYLNKNLDETRESFIEIIVKMIQETYDSPTLFDEQGGINE